MSEEAALDRIMAYVEDLGLFSSEITSKRRVIAKGVFVAVLNDFEDPELYLNNVSPQMVVTTFSCQIFPIRYASPLHRISRKYWRNRSVITELTV